MYEDWKNFRTENEITKRSLIYWVQNDAPEKYEEIKKNTVDYYIEETLESGKEGDIAILLYVLYKNRFICASIKHNKWFEYVGHKWKENDSGVSLRRLMSKDLHAIYKDKIVKAVWEMHDYEKEDPRWKATQTRTNKLSDIALKLKSTNDKKKIMEECKELFYDSSFFEKKDNNPYLMCCNNGVLDFSTNEFRDGNPEDYITMSTGIDYVDVSKPDKEMQEKITGINKFIDTLFPEEKQRNYMWQHLASILIGINKKETFHIYTGGGSNGKSMLVDFLGKIIGDYRATISVSLLTGKRLALGQANSDVAQLVGKRLAIMNEPSKSERLNEGPLKELTGADTIKTRPLYCDAFEFKPQFKMIVCTNSLFDIKSNDDGTWRRIRVAPFISKFVDKGEHYEDDARHVFEKDYKLSEKHEQWKEIFLGMLAKIAFEKSGYVEDCDAVCAASNKYRQSQDYLLQFITECIVQEEGKELSQSEVSEEYKRWYQDQYQSKPPKISEIYDEIDKRFTKRPKHGKWQNLTLSCYKEKNDTILTQLTDASNNIISN